MSEPKYPKPFSVPDAFARISMMCYEKNILIRHAHYLKDIALVSI